MEDRYEIRGKIGQGGLGSVYRAFDRKMNREVAIKRITAGMDEGLADESTRQLLKEAGALSSLQHPHIVTVHDFGSDEDGPYVVMELIAGKTLDEIIVHSPLTWQDFKELALQTQEALIAAQDLDLIHSDLKPSNLMLTWLPSGKFQVKIVDFGLAVLSQSQCRKEIEAMDTVFGSIFFMPPEQFERKPLDSRSDLYSIGCVYYQALTSRYPFRGKTGHEVMQSHLNHVVVPLHELRDDIPEWVCDWVMWHINHKPQERPETAREALAAFLKYDKMPNPTMSPGKQVVEEPKRPKLIIPSGASSPSASPANPATAPILPAQVTPAGIQPSPSSHLSPGATPAGPSTSTDAGQAPAAQETMTRPPSEAHKVNPAPTHGEDSPPPQTKKSDAAQGSSSAPAKQPSESDESNPASTKTKAYSRPKLVLPQRASDPVNPLGQHNLRATPTVPDSSITVQQPLTSGAAQAVGAPPLHITTAHLTVARVQAITSATTPQQLPPAPAVPTTKTTDHVPTVTSAVPTLTSPIATVAAPQPLQPPAGAKPSIHTSPVTTQGQPQLAGQPTSLLTVTGAHPTIAAPHMGGATVNVSTFTPPKKKGLSSAAKAMLATAMSILILIMGWVLMERMKQNRVAETLNRLVLKASSSNATELPITKSDLDLLLASASNVGFNKHRASIYKALLIAKATDGTEIDNTIANYVIGREMLAEVRETLIRDVLRMRKNPQVVSTLLNYATTTQDARSTISSLQAVRFMVEDKHFEAIVRIMLSTSNPDVRKAAEDTANEIIEKSPNRTKLADSLSAQYGTALNSDIRYSLLRLLGSCGGEKATAKVQEIISSGDSQQIIAALSALGSWGDGNGFPIIVGFIKQSRDPNLRSRAFDAAHRYLGQINDGAKQVEYWSQLAPEAKTRDEQIKIIHGVAYLDGDWSLQLVESYLKSPDEDVQAVAEKLRDDMLERRKLQK
jgi:serine/threonine protein kinase